MPLLRLDVIEGRSDEELSRLLSVIHDVLVTTFQIPIRDRYQVVQSHKRTEMIMEDTGLGFPRSESQILLQLISRPRTRQMKQAFYKLLAERLEVDCGIAKTDLVISFTENSDEDWSFGMGRAQFLTGELR